MISRLTFKRSGLLVGTLYALLFPALSNAQSPCVHATDDGGNRRSVPVSLGSALHLNFIHSIYASQVEEIFLIRANGFELTQLRYGEARLVDFYGHEAARRDNGMWIVTPAPAFLPALHLNLSVDALMSVRAGDQKITLPPAAAYRVTVGDCNDHGHD